MKTLCLLSLLFCWPAQANSLSLSFGPSLDGSIGDKKALQLGYEFQFGAPSLVLEAGGWNEPNGVAGFAGVNMGVHVATTDGVFVRVGVGVCAISQTDDRLSSIGEAHIQLKFGVERESFSAGLQFDHFSNAGLVPPNLGRDLGSVFIGIPL